MSESPQRQAVIVGLFVAIGLTILAGGVATIGGLNDQFSRRIHVTSTFDDVGGLTTGDNVWFSGVPVGTVSAVRFDEASRVQVELAIDLDASQYIHHDASAKIGSDGLIGNPIVVLFGGEAGALEDGQTLPAVAVLSTEQMMAKLNENNENILAITTDLKGLSARIAAGQGSVGRLLKDDALYVDIQGAVADLRAASANAHDLTANLAAFSGDLNQDGSLPKQIVNDRDTWTSLAASVDRLESVTTSIEQSATQTTGPLGTLLNDPEAAADLKETLDNLSTGSERLSENMEALQHNFLFRGYFKKKARETDTETEPAPPTPAPSVDGNADARD